MAVEDGLRLPLAGSADANLLLRAALDELYEQDPSVRPSPEAVEAAARRLGLA